MRFQLTSYLNRHVGLLFLFEQVHVIAQTCYFPDQSTVALGYLPCEPTVDGIPSPCCRSDDVCSASGICIGPDGVPYRGGCTDRMWLSPDCGVSPCNDGIV